MERNTLPDGVFLYYHEGLRKKYPILGSRTAWLGHGLYIAPSRPGELHPEPITDPDLSLSTHPARATPRKLPPSVRTSRFLLLPVDQVDPNAGDPPPSLHGHYSVSSVLRGSPPLAGASVLSASRNYRLRLFPYHHQPGSQVPYESPDEIHAAYTPDTAWPSPVSMSFDGFRCVISSSLSLVFLIPT